MVLWEELCFVVCGVFGGVVRCDVVESSVLLRCVEHGIVWCCSFMVCCNGGV